MKTQIKRNHLLSGMKIILGRKGVSREIIDKIENNFKMKTDKEIWTNIYKAGIRECLKDGLTPEEIEIVEGA